MKLFLLTALLLSSLLNGAVIEVKGYGPTPSQAKDEALRELSQSVISKIDSSYNKSEKLSNKSFKKDISTSLKVNSKITFQGVEMDEPYKDKDTNEYSVNASISEKALDDTITYMLKSLDGDHLVYSVSKLKELQKVIDQLSALSSFTSNYSSKYNTKDLQAKISELKEQNNKELNYGRVKIITNGNLSIDGKSYEASKLHFMPVGSYNYVISKNGCVSEKGSVYLSKAKLTKKSVKLFCNVNAGASFSINADDTYQRVIKSTITKYGFKVSNNSENQIKISLDKIKTFEIDGIKFYDYMVYMQMSFYDRTITKKARLKSVTSDKLNSKMLKLTPLMIKAGFKEL